MLTTFENIIRIIFIFILLSSSFIFSHTRDPKFDQISIDQGLSHPAVYSMKQDYFGFLWVATQDGLNRYDGYYFQIYKHDPYDTTSISHNWITSICESDPYTLWIGTNGGGLNKFNQKTREFTTFPDLNIQHIQTLLLDSENKLWVGSKEGLYRINLEIMELDRFPEEISQFENIINRPILSLCEDHDKNIWITTKGYGFAKYSPQNQTIKIYDQKTLGINSEEPLTINTIYEDNFNLLWLGTEGSGLISFDPSTEKCDLHLNHDSTIPNNGINRILSILEDKEEGLWLGTRGGGIVQYNKKSGRFFGHKCAANTVCCLGNNTINMVYRDDTGVLWLGTDCCGLNKSVLERNTVSHHTSELTDFNVFVQTRAWSFFEDHSSILWIATSEGVREFIPELNIFIHHHHDPFNDETLSNNAATVIFEDSKRNIWVGTEDGLNLFNRKTAKFKHYKHNIEDSNSISDNGIVTIEEDYRGILWIGTRLGGLNEFDTEREIFRRYLPDFNDSIRISNSAIMDIFESPINKTLWLGTFNGGLLNFNPITEKFTHFIKEKNVPNSLSHNSVYSICSAGNGKLWIGTYGGGLNRFDPETGLFEFYREKEGLLHDQILTIIPDNKNNIWLSTASGLCVFNAEIEKFRNYNLNIGLRSNMFDRGAFYKNDKGEFYYSSVSGIHKFNPEKIDISFNIPRINLTGFYIQDKQVSDYSWDNQDLQFDLSYDQNYFSFEFAIMDFANPSLNQFAYRLKGEDEKWIFSGEDRFVRFLNVNPGTYTLQVKGSNYDGIWNDEGITISVNIASPPWRTFWAYLLYILTFVGIVFIFWQESMRKEKLNNQILFERFKTERLNEMDQLKSRFFANIAHEFRSPLTLILGPVEKLITKIKDHDLRQEISMMERNAQKVMSLTDQLLDLSRLEAGKMPIKAQNLNIVKFLQENIRPFYILAESKLISLSFISDRDEIFVYFDPDLMEKVISNLLSNAIKFAPYGGHTSIAVVSQIEKDNLHIPIPGLKLTKDSWYRWVQIAINDNGPGLPPDQIEKIFEHFYQYSHSNIHNKGTGVGLSLAKELVELHKGKILVTSRPGEGSTFTITLRLGREHFKDSDIVSKETTGEAFKEKISTERNFIHTPGEENKFRTTSSNEKDVVLIVDDNTDIREYIRKNFSNYYKVIEAANGKEGFYAAVENIPDLIISDVIMPEMDGIALCEKVKSEESTSHIPLILLTVQAEKNDKMYGLECGADDYITKPFDIKELHLRTRNLIKQRKKLRDHFSKELSFEIKNKVTSNSDERFLQRAIGVVEQNLSNPEFSVEDFCKELGISRPQLHRKLIALTNESASKFIRKLKLKYSASLLTTGAGNVFDVAQSVGFNNLSYFAKCFKEEFGLSPSEYLSKVKNM